MAGLGAGHGRGSQAAAVFLAAATLVVLLLPGARAFGEAQKYLIVSAPSTHRIAYLKMPENGMPAVAGEPMRILADKDKGLSVPQGLAVDQYRKRLFVADPDLNGLAAYNIIHDGDALTVGPRTMVANNIETRWVAVDGVGNVYLTDEGRNRILKLPVQAIDEAFNGASPKEATVIYEKGTHEAVSSPGGIDTDNFFVFWLNKASGTSLGSVVRGPSTPTSDTNVPPVTALAKNTMKSYGVCLANKHAFYSDEQNNFYVVPRKGGDAATVSTSLDEPRGCAFDGEGTVYVADKGLNAVYSFGANAVSFTPATRMDKAADLQGAFGVAMYIRVIE